MTRSSGTLCALVLVLVLAPMSAHAGTILQPAGASAQTSADAGDISHVRDQSGLSSGYTSGVTNFEAYIASNPTHDSNPSSNIWVGFRPSGTHVDFDLGGLHPIQAMALWNLGGNFGANIFNITLLADDNPAFSSPDALGSFIANPNTGPVGAVLPQVIPFAPTNASWVRLVIDHSLADGVQEGAFGEAAFEVVPEPGALACLAAAGTAAALRRRRR